ncbi:MAG: GMC family oxidoreductase, partial [Elusimicrobia bacterium]|nr:GMC family oxidoreductase [Elusimicrobiota bacterium]
HAGLPEDGLAEAVRRRLALMPLWTRAYVGASAWAARWAAPLAFLGRLAPLERLSPRERERLLAKLIGARPAIRGLFLGARAVVLAACYAPAAPPAPPRRAAGEPAAKPSRSRASYDVIVAGSGAGGCAAAGRLAELGARVLLVETGVRAASPPDAFEAVLRYYAHGGFWSPTGNCLMPVPTGRALGGTTTINSGTCLDPPVELLAGWERESRGAFEAAEFGGLLAEARRRLGARRAPPETASVSSTLFLRGAASLGWPNAGYLDRAETSCSGRGRCCFVCPDGAKTTADRAFLEPLAGRPELTLATGVSLESFRPAERRGGPVRVRLRGPDGAASVSCRALILACGALTTPYFVRRQRLGAGWRSAGDGLSVHPAAKLFALFDERVEGWKGVPQGAGCLDPELPGLRYEGVSTPLEIAAMTLPLEGRALREWMDRYERVATFGLMAADSGRGKIRYPAGPRFPWVRYDLHPADTFRLSAGILRLARLFFAAGASRVLAPFVTAPNDFGGADALRRRDPKATRPGELQLMAFHPLGTCAMGRVAGWDQRLAEGVYVSDGSAVPGPLGVNPQMTIYALGLRLAERLARGSRPAA